MSNDNWYNNWDVVWMNHYLQRHGVDARYQDGKFIIGNISIDATWDCVKNYVDLVLE